MRMYDIIAKKRDGYALTNEEIRFFVKGVTDGSIPDYQASALLMAIFLNSMTEDELNTLTYEMAKSGDMIDLSNIEGIKADKHSTGGVGDKTSLIVAPIVASYGIKIPKMSGRGLGHTGGTVDKLESIKGFNVELTSDELVKQVKDIGICITGQSANLAPADKVLYALRDVTATVNSLPLIASSIMSKKLASGSDIIVLDVKFGSGAFMETIDDAKKLAQMMVKIGNSNGRKTAAIISDMDTPLGNAIGNSLEVIEAIETLKGNGPADLTKVCVCLSALTLSLALDKGIDECEQMAYDAINNGSALAKFKEFTTYQGGDSRIIDDYSLFDKASYSHEIKATKDGYISKCDTTQIGISAMILGAGRKEKNDKIDYSAGIILKAKTGDYVKRGDVIATLYTNNKDSITNAEETFINAITFSDEKPQNTVKEDIIIK